MALLFVISQKISRHLLNQSEVNLYQLRLFPHLETATLDLFWDLIG